MRAVLAGSVRYYSFADLQQGLRRAGLESSNLIVGIDFTKSNQHTGAVSFQGRCLHELSRDGTLNPYERVLSSIGQTLEVFDDDQQIPAFGFGDARTTNRAVFPLDNAGPCHTFQGVLAAYRATVPRIQLSGPTNFAPLIRRAIEICQSERSYHILLIVTDGEVINVDETSQAIIDASHHPLSIIAVGVGDGPFDQMHTYDDRLEARVFDNFQFIEYEAVMGSAGRGVGDADVAFALQAMMEVPQQYATIRRLGYLG